jgi:hypothetical protein
MKRRRREGEAISIAFLDIITCGFGAVILLFVILKVGEPEALEQTEQPTDNPIADLQRQLFELRGETRILNRDLNAREEQLSVWEEEVARLQQQLTNKTSDQKQIAQESSMNAIIEGQLQQAKQDLTEEMRRLLAERDQPRSDLVGGIPVDSEYIIFIIDTSGSMFQYSWGKMLQQFNQVLNTYPQVKGFQVMNDMGTYMFSNYRGKWIPDTPARRKATLQRLRSWNAFSNSSPVEGIVAAIRTYYSPDKKISLYVFGDEFSGNSIRHVVDTIERINRKDANGNPMVRIHAVGFPVQFAAPPHLQGTGIKFAALMRELTRRNGGTFVGLNDFR